VSLGAIRRIGKVQAPQQPQGQQAVAETAEHSIAGSIADGGSVKGSSIVGSVVGSEVAPPAPPTMVKVKIHVALQTFLATSRLPADPKEVSPHEREMPVTALEGTTQTKKAEKKTGVVQMNPTLVEDTYQDVSRSLIPTANMNMLQNSSSPNKLAQGSAFRDEPQMSGALTTPLRRPKTPNGTDTGGLSGAKSMNSSGIMGASSAFPSPGEGPDMDQRERLFHKLAPPLKDSQRFLVALSLVSDVARTIMVRRLRTFCDFVLCRWPRFAFNTNSNITV
jgi:hypothetical protein